jgi:hypothetical protein
MKTEINHGRGVKYLEKSRNKCTLNRFEPGHQGDKDSDERRVPRSSNGNPPHHIRSHRNRLLNNWNTLSSDQLHQMEPLLYTNPITFQDHSIVLSVPAPISKLNYALSLTLMKGR